MSFCQAPLVAAQYNRMGGAALNEFSRISKSDVGELPVEARPRKIFVVNNLYQRLRTFLAVGALILITLGVFRAGWVHHYGGHSALGAMPLINLDDEQSFQAWWSSLQFVLAGGGLCC